MRVTVDEAVLTGDVVGDGRPVLMFHPPGLDSTCLRPWHDALTERGRARLLYYDHRWCGQSDRVGPATHARWLDDAAAVLDHTGDRRAVIFGFSYGAWLALAFALRYPQRVAGLALCGASPQFDYAADAVAAAQARDPVAAAALVDGLAVAPLTDAALGAVWRRILPLYFAGPVRHDVLARTRFAAHAFAESMAALATFTTVERLGEIRPPVLVLTGARDFITPPAQGRRLVAGVPNGRYVELAGSGHFPFVEDNPAYLAAFVGWLAEVP